MIVLGWGYQPERSLAFIYIFLYTFFGALPLLIVLLQAGAIDYTWSLFYLSFSGLSMTFTSDGLIKALLSMLTIIAFLVKFPLYAVHLWLPKAHVEAPITGSIILAGLLLKIGGFGWFLMIPFFKRWVLLSFVASFGGVGALIIRFVCLRQTDIKVLIAYSSVAHMGIVIIAFSVGTSICFTGGLLIMVAHGFSSPALFFGANCFYSRSGSRNIILNSSQLQFVPVIALFWFISCIANIRAPPSRNLVSEIVVIAGLINLSLAKSLQIVFLVFLSGAYTLILYSSSQQGQKKSKFFSSNQTRTVEIVCFTVLRVFTYGLTLMVATI